jgi:hypothetical protein
MTLRRVRKSSLLPFRPCSWRDDPTSVSSASTCVSDTQACGLGPSYPWPRIPPQRSLGVSCPCGLSQRWGLKSTNFRKIGIPIILKAVNDFPHAKQRPANCSHRRWNHWLQLLMLRLVSLPWASEGVGLQAPASGSSCSRSSCTDSQSWWVSLAWWAPTSFREFWAARWMTTFPPHSRWRRSDAVKLSIFDPRMSGSGLTSYPLCARWIQEYYLPLST